MQKDIMNIWEASVPGLFFFLLFSVSAHIFASAALCVTDVLCDSQGEGEA